MSAIEEAADGPIEVIQVLFALHPSFGAQDLCGPFEVLNNAFHKLNDPGNPASLPVTIAALYPVVDRLDIMSYLANIPPRQEARPLNAPL